MAVTSGTKDQRSKVTLVPTVTLLTGSRARLKARILWLPRLGRVLIYRGLFAIFPGALTVYIGCLEDSYRSVLWERGMRRHFMWADNAFFCWLLKSSSMRFWPKNLQLKENVMMSLTMTRTIPISIPLWGLESTEISAWSLTAWQWHKNPSEQEKFCTKGDNTIFRGEQMPWARDFIRSCGISDSQQVAVAVSTTTHSLGNP